MSLMGIAGLRIEKTIQHCILNLLPTPNKGKKMFYKMALLGLVLARQCIAIHWSKPVAPTQEKWGTDLQEWATGEEVRLKKVRTDENAD